MLVMMLRRARVRISTKRKMCQVVDESSLPAMVEAVQNQNQEAAGGRQNRVLNRNLRNGRRGPGAGVGADAARLTAARRRRSVRLGQAAKLPLKVLWSVLKFMCVYADRPVDLVHDELQDDATRMWFRMNPTYEDRSYLMVQDSVRFGLLM
ncbi:hypothetical protein MPTK1_6g20120 [Marchantia polymorpha subsp. ruderalis]|nr:hypothetical protein MARPO_0045s0052 [Marchantia polymorpha]BBN15506.1 hypothetical protein Mp_6g20120 [Marchantia polymorpha subsp. ruderalis]|eukprot:PTQ39383.1 hypothetical protein MARPO_0045s0052 [Marchantia polymorpha]